LQQLNLKTGSRSLNGLDLNNVLESGCGRSGRSTRSSTLPTILEEPEIPIGAQKDHQEIKQRLLNMHISSLGDMSEDEKKAKIAHWIVHFDKDTEDKEQQPDSKVEEEEEKQDTEDKEQQPEKSECWIKRPACLMKQFSLLEIISTAVLLAAVVVDLSRVFHAVDSVSYTSSCSQVHTCS